MWTRAELKDRAKQSMTVTYRTALLASILVFLLTGGVDFVFRIDSMKRSATGTGLLSVPLGAGLTVFSILFTIFVANLFRVGESRFFLENRAGRADLHNLVWGFGPDYPNLVKAQFTTDVIIVLWTLLFLVPGMIAEYRYCMVPYLLSENPQMSGKHARELSDWMTRDQKWEIFVLDLSFLGWYLLGLLCLVVGAVFVLPYPSATRAELYLALKARDNPAAYQNPEVNENAPVET